MKRSLLLAVLASLGVALAASLPAVAVGATRPAKIRLAQTSLGKILVNRGGFTIYAFTRDTRNHDSCQSVRNCLTAWPPVTTHGAPIAGTGVHKSLLGTIKLKSGKRQVTYNGHPLYTYIGDTHPGETRFVNIFQFGGRWPALNAAGKEVK